MNEWIYSAQRYLISGFKDKSALSSAITQCHNSQVEKLLDALPLRVRCEADLKEVLALESAVTDPLAKFVIRLLAFSDFIFAIQSPVGLSSDYINACFGVVSRLADDCSQFEELRTSSGFLFSILGNGFAELEKKSEARTAYEKALEIYRELDIAEPDVNAQNLAMTLDNYGNLLSELCDFSAAIVACREALVIYQSLAKTDQIAYLPKVVTSLNNQGTLQSELRDYEAARASWEEALQISRRLVETDPKAHLPDLAMTLNNLGVLMCDLRDYDVAQKAYKEALLIYQRLADNDPDEYLPDVAMTHNNYGALQFEIRDLIEAKSAYETAILIYRELAKANKSAYVSDVAMTLNNLGALHRRLRDFHSGQNAYEEALYIYRRLTETEPEANIQKVAMTLSNLGTLQRSARNFGAARKAYEEALLIYRKLSKTHLVIYLPNVAMALNNLGNLLNDLREFSTAKKVFEEALTIRRKLAEIDPNVHSPKVATSLNSLGALLCDLRDFGAAQASYEEALIIRRKLAEQKPSAHLPDLAMTLNNLGNLLCDMQDVGAARTLYEEALVIYRKLTETHPDAYKPYMASTLNNLGALLRNEREFIAAHAMYKEILQLYRSLELERPGVHLQDVAMTLNNIGALLRNIRDVDKAEAACEEALSIYRKLANIDPDVYMPRVATTLNNLGNIFADKHDLVAARASYEEAVYVAETTTHEFENIHLQKNTVATGYQFLLAEATANDASNYPHAFNICVAMRDGRAASMELGQSTLSETQKWLSIHSAESNIHHQILIANIGPDDKLIVGLVDESICHFEHIDKGEEDWALLIPNFGVAKNLEEEKLRLIESERRQQFARSFWKSLSALLQSALTRKTRHITLISGDVFWSNFPWELLRFDCGEDDYLGLHQALPRIGALQAADLESQLNFQQLGSGSGTMTVLAPFDTGNSPLKGVVEEVDKVQRLVKRMGGTIVDTAVGAQASNLAIEKQIKCSPDIFYYSGHGTIVLNEEMLVLHRDLSSETELPDLFYFGKAQLKRLRPNGGDKLFPDNPLVVLNSCFTGRARVAGGMREDLLGIFLDAGAGAVIATSIPLFDSVGCAWGELLFDITPNTDLASVVINARKRLAQGLCRDLDSPLWGVWSMIHVHGNANVKYPLKAL